MSCEAVEQSLEFLYDQALGILQEILPNLETLYGAIELDEEPEKEAEIRKIVGDQVAIITCKFLEVMGRLRAYYTLQELKCEVEREEE